MNISKRLLAAALALVLLAAGCQSPAQEQNSSSPASQSQPAQEEPSPPAESTPESVPEEGAAEKAAPTACRFSPRKPLGRTPPPASWERPSGM